MQTKMPLRRSKSIDEIEVRDLKGFKYGLIWVGNCIAPNRIVSIRMKYADSAKKFYDELLERFKQRFGEPSEWRGDPFHIVISWKWSFVDDQKNRISIILEHNKRDEDETVGNTVKMTMWNLIEEERNCENRKIPRTGREVWENIRRASRIGISWFPVDPRRPAITRQILPARLNFIVSFALTFHAKRSWRFGPPRCMKMTRRSPDERLQTAADCLSRLVWGLRPDLFP